MATIVTRAGKGSALTHNEVDANFNNLNSAKVETSTISSFGATLVDDADAGAARTTLGLGTAAVLSVGTGANNIVQLNGSSLLPAVDGSQLTNLPASGDGGIAMAIALG
tara:strand:+ start:523 stop:849 length:327 start_codon:yes stop_codon:yes gene_type:complete